MLHYTLDLCAILTFSRSEQLNTSLCEVGCSGWLLHSCGCVMGAMSAHYQCLAHIPHHSRAEQSKSVWRLHYRSISNCVLHCWQWCPKTKQHTLLVYCATCSPETTSPGSRFVHRRLGCRFAENSSLYFSFVTSLYYNKLGWHRLMVACSQVLFIMHWPVQIVQSECFARVCSFRLVIRDFGDGLAGRLTDAVE
jgi:hypothetical protein